MKDRTIYVDGIESNSPDQTLKGEIELGRVVSDIQYNDIPVVLEKIYNDLLT